MKDIIVYDAETKYLNTEVEGGWNNIFGMGIATCVCYDYAKDLYNFFGDTEEEHIRLLDFLNGKIAVTFNGIHFDSQLLLGNDRTVNSKGVTSGSPFGKKITFGNFDIYAEIWKGFFETDDVVDALKQQEAAKYLRRKNMWNLDTIAENTLGGTINKTGDGADAPQKWKDCRMRELWEYNLADTKCEKALFEFVRKYKYVVNGNYDIVKLR